MLDISRTDPPVPACCRSTRVVLAALGMTLAACSAEPVAPVSLLFEGDSDIELWDTSGYADAANVGVGGAVCRDVLDTIDDTLETYQPRRVVLVCGENDLGQQAVGATFRDFSEVVSRIHDTGAVVFYMGTKPEPSTTPLHGDYRAYDDRIRSHARSLSSNGTAPLVMVDVHQGFEDLGNPGRLYRRDALHLSAEGYALWDRWLTTALANEDCLAWLDDSCVEVPSR